MCVCVCKTRSVRSVCCSITVMTLLSSEGDQEMPEWEETGDSDYIQAHLSVCPSAL